MLSCFLFLVLLLVCCLLFVVFLLLVVGVGVGVVVVVGGGGGGGAVVVVAVVVAVTVAVACGLFVCLSVRPSVCLFACLLCFVVCRFGGYLVALFVFCCFVICPGRRCGCCSWSWTGPWNINPLRMTVAAVFAIALFAVFFSIELWRVPNKQECQSIQPNQAGKKIQGSKSGWAKNSKSVRKATANKSDWKRNKGSKSREAKASETKTRKKQKMQTNRKQESGKQKYII